MSDFIVTRVYPSDTKAMEQVVALLASQNLTLDKNLDYIAAIYDGETVIGTGSAYKNSLRCFAIDPNYKGAALLNTLLTYLVDMQYERGNYELFIYTKTESAKFFKDLGFYEIASIDNVITFLENNRIGFTQYIKKLQRESADLVETMSTKKGCNPSELEQHAIVMNANPFTLGHLHLVEQASKTADILHLFMVSDDSSLVPFSVRKRLILAGTAHIDNIVYHECGPYMISSATFPGYFQKDKAHVVESQAALDINIFSTIAKALHIRKRFVGDEPLSGVTHMYNKTMARELPKYGIEQVVVPRIETHLVTTENKVATADLTDSTQVISASIVRQAIKDGNWPCVKAMTPASTYEFFRINEAKPIIDVICKADDVIHH